MMIRITKAIACLTLVAAVSLLAAPAFAGILDTGVSYWQGSKTFHSLDNPDLEGRIDWAVFAPGDFPFTDEGNLGRNPPGLFDPTDNEFVYAYQLYGSGADNISFKIIPLENLADNIGAFTDSDLDPDKNVTGKPPTNMQLDAPGAAWWQFGGIGAGENSEGLAFCSGNAPIAGYAIVIDGGANVEVGPIAVPGTTPIPEPATVWSLAMALGVLAIWRLRRK